MLSSRRPDAERFRWPALPLTSGSSDGLVDKVVWLKVAICEGRERLGGYSHELYGLDVLVSLLVSREGLQWFEQSGDLRAG
jgi:hypothetical protein